MVYFLFVLGFALLVKGADWLVDGSSSIAKNLGVSDLIIGLTIVAFGTSAPELIVNIFASLKGESDIAIGNILGSNICNILLILGIASLIYPLHLKKNVTWKQIPISFLAVLMVFLMSNDVSIDGAAASVLGRIDGLILITIFVIFMLYIVHLASTEKNQENGFKKYSTLKATSMTVLGIAALTIGGRWVVDGAVVLAQFLGLSEAFIGLTIVAVGTSLPELATSAVAAYKKNSDIAVGNIVGSNIFNIFWILGLSSVIKPLPFVMAMNDDIFVLVLATFLLFIFAFIGEKHRITRINGVIFLMTYVAYIAFLLIRG